MREIRFKAYDKYNKYIVDIDGYNLYLADGSIYEISEKVIEYECFMSREDVSERYIVLEYTGVHDNTDDEICVFEGDIVEFNYEGEKYIGHVKFEVGTFIIACNEIPDTYIRIYEIVQVDRDYAWIDGKVIGNMFQNIELLKENS